MPSERRLATDSRGGLLVEVLAALLILGLVGSAVLTGVSTTHRSRSTVQRQSLAENIARNQVEYIFSQPFQPPPTPYLTVTPPAGYSVTVTTAAYVCPTCSGAPNTEQVVVIVSRGVGQVLTLETLRLK